MNQKAETKLGNHRGQCLIRRTNIARIFFVEKRSDHQDTFTNSLITEQTQIHQTYRFGILLR